MRKGESKNELIESQREAIDNFSMSNTSISRDLDELVIVAVEEPTSVTPQHDNKEIHYYYLGHNIQEFSCGF